MRPSAVGLGKFCHLGPTDTTDSPVFACDARRNEALDVPVLATDNMNPVSIISGISMELLWPDFLHCLLKDLWGFRSIRFGSPAYYQRIGQMKSGGHFPERNRAAGE